MRSNVEWRDWGRRDAFYAVAAWDDRQKDGERPWTADEFYATGASDWEDYVRQWESYGIDRRCCVEIGCGAGRLTRALAEAFEQVNGLDVSADMIALAEKAAPARTSFFITDGLDMPLPSASATAVFSTFVFQHFDSIAEADDVWSEVSRILRPNASLMIQLPVHSWPIGGRLYRVLYLGQKMLGDIRARARRRGLSGKASQPFMRYLSYEASELVDSMSRLGFGDIEIRSFRVRSNSSFQTFVFARRLHN